MKHLVMLSVVMMWFGEAGASFCCKDKAKKYANELAALENIKENTQVSRLREY